MFIKYGDILFNLNNTKRLSLYKNYIRLYFDEDIAIKFENDEKAKNAFDKILVGLSMKDEIVNFD